jgi:NADPH-dependent glutamate synthase beta subunit-like oxidoreductase
MQFDDGGVALGNLGDEQAALIRAMGGVKTKGGSMFAAAQQMNNPEGLMFTGTAVRAVAARVAASKVEKQQKQAADAELRRLAETTHGGRQGRGGRRRRSRALILEGCRCRVRRAAQR